MASYANNASYASILDEKILVNFASHAGNNNNDSNYACYRGNSNHGHTQGVICVAVSCGRATQWNISCEWNRHF